MFDPDFFPTPENVIATMLNGYSLEGKTILEPSAGNGNIVDFCIGAGAFLIACEKQPELKKILQTKCNVIDYVKYEWNTSYDWGFFEIKGFKKGTMHFKFKDLDVWAKFNQHVSRLKGYPLFEGK